MFTSVIQGTAGFTEAALLRSARQLQPIEEELATGQTILSASPSDAMIGTQMQGQLGMLTQTAQNLRQDQAMLAVAAGATESIQGILQHMQNLAVQASNATQNATDRQTLQAQFDHLLQTLATISQTTVNGHFLLQVPPTANPVITAIHWEHLGPTPSTNYQLTVEGYQFPPVPTEPLPNNQAITLPSTTNVAQLILINFTQGWTAGFRELDSPNNYGTDAPLPYVKWSSSAITIAGNGQSSGGLGLASGNAIKIQIASTSSDIVYQNDLAKADAVLTHPSGTAYFPLPTHRLGSLQLPGVTVQTLGLAGANLSTINQARSALRTLKTAQVRLAQSQARLGSQQDALQTQLSATQTQYTQLAASHAAVSDVNMTTAIRQLSQTEGVRQSGLAVLVDEQAIQLHTAQVLQHII